MYDVRCVFVSTLQGYGIEHVGSGFPRPSVPALAIGRKELPLDRQPETSTHLIYFARCASASTGCTL
jgi:hypothetical protein